MVWSESPWQKAGEVIWLLHQAPLTPRSARGLGRRLHPGTSRGAMWQVFPASLAFEVRQDLYELQT